MYKLITREYSMSIFFCTWLRQLIYHQPVFIWQTYLLPGIYLQLEQKIPGIFLFTYGSDEVYTIAIKALESLVFVWLLIFLVFSIVFFHAPTPILFCRSWKAFFLLIPSLIHPASLFFFHQALISRIVYFVQQAYLHDHLPLRPQQQSWLAEPSPIAHELIIWNRDLFKPEQLCFSRDGYFYCTREKITSRAPIWNHQSINSMSQAVRFPL